MYRKHLGHQKGILPLHLLGEEQAALLVVNQFSHCIKTFPAVASGGVRFLYPRRPPWPAMAAIRLRMRMRTAPKLVISSILSWV